MSAKGRAHKTATNDCQGKNSCKGKGYVITTDAKSCEGLGGHVGKKAPMLYSMMSDSAVRRVDSRTFQRVNPFCTSRPRKVHAGEHRCEQI